MEVLITGGLGFLGIHLAKQLVDRGDIVILYDSMAPHNNEKLEGTAYAILGSENVKQVQGDITDVLRFADVVKQNNIDIVVHLAALLTDECTQSPVHAAQVNCVGGAVVFENARNLGIKKVVYGSSVAVFSNTPGLPLGDNRPYDPPNIYGASKVFLEYMARAMMRNDPRLDFVGLRFGWIYGAGKVRGWNDIQNVIVNFALEKETVYYPDYDLPNDWTYVSDAASALISCIDSSRPSVPVYNVKGDYRPIQDAVKYLHHKFPRVYPEPYFAKLYPNAWDFKSDHIISDTGFAFKVGLEEGLDLMVNEIRVENGLESI